MATKLTGVTITVRGQRIQGTARQYINETIDISPPRISGSTEEKLAVLDSLGFLMRDNNGDPLPESPSHLASAAGFTQLEYKRKYPSWVCTDILS